MAGYVRQSAADIVPTAVVRAAPINNELNALRDAFAQSGGHKHNGSAAEGEYIPLIADTTAKDKVVIDGTNHRVGVFVNVSDTSTEQIRVQDGAVLPVTTNDVDLGNGTFKFKDLNLAGTATLPVANIASGTIASSSLTMTGNIAMGSNKITGLGTPTTGTDATTKTYVDDVFSGAISSAAAAAASATAAAASYDSFDDRYLGSKSSAPTVDNDGNALLTGALYWNTAVNTLFIWTGSVWTQAAFTAIGFATLTGTETLTNKTLTAPVLTTPNITTGLQLTGDTGSAGQFLSSAGSGNAPVWVTPVTLTEIFYYANL